MKKKLISLLVAAVMIFGIIPVYALDASELTAVEQSFAGLSETPEGWTIEGTKDTHYVFNSDSIATAVKGGSYVKAYYSNAFDMEGAAYQVTFNIGHYSSGSSFVHIGADEKNVVSDTAASNGYSIELVTKDFAKAIIRVYKNGEVIGTLPDGGSTYSYQNLRKFEFSVADGSVTLSGAGNTITMEDEEPIYSGYLGFVLKDSNSAGKTRLSYFKINRLLEVSGSNISDSHGTSDDIEIDFNYPLEASTVNQTNIYVTDENGNSLSKTDYSVSGDGSKAIISFNIKLEYTKNYNVVIGKGLYIEGTEIGMASQQIIPFTTEDPPFYVRCTADGNTLNIKIGNTIYQPQDFKVFIKATGSGGEILGNYVYSVTMPETGETFELSDTVNEDLTSAETEVYAVAENNTPLLEDFFKLDAENGTTAAEIYANRLTESAKASVAEAMASGEYTDIDTLYTDFVKAVVTASINGWNEKGYNHIDDVFAANGVFIGLELDEYNGAVDPSAMNEYIYNYGISSFTDIQTAVNEAILSTDQAYYTHTFSKADAEESNWDFYVSDVLDNTLTENTAGVVFNDEKGIYLPKTAAVKTISKFDVSGNYEISGTFSREYNDLVFYFSYIDSSNWCRAMFSYSNDTRQSTTIARCVNGTVTTYATYNNGTASERKVIVEEDGYVTIRNNSDETIIARTYVGGPLEKGKIGFALQYAQGYIRTVNVLTYLKGEADVTENNVPVETDKVNVTFNFPIRPATAIKENISVTENGNRLTDYTIQSKTDGTGFDILFGSPLKYKSRYDIIISDDVKVNYGKAKLADEQIITFNTEEPPFNVKGFYGKSGETDVFVNDMSSVNEVYTAYSKLTDLADTDITVTLEAENNTNSDEAVSVVFELADENGKALYNSGLLPVTVPAGDSCTITEAVHIPAGVTENSKFTYFVFDTEEKLHTKYPFTDAEAVGAGELPQIAKNGNKIKIWGSTVSKSPYKNINILLKTEQNGEVLKTASANTDENGNYSFEFELNKELLTKSDYVNVNISGEEYEKALTEKIYFASDSDRNNAVKDINDRTDTKQAIADNADILDIKSANKYGVKLYENLDSDGLTKLASLTDGGKRYSETDGGQQLLKKIMEFMVIIHYNSGNSKLLYSADGSMLTDDIIDFSSLAETGNTYRIYKENLKEAGQSAVRSGILNKNCNTVEDLCKIFAQNVVVCGVNNWNVNGYGHICKLLTENASVSGLDVTKYVNLKNRTSFEQSLLNNPVKDFSDLQSRINNISGSSGSGGSGSGSGSSGSSGGGSIVKGNYGIATESTGVISNMPFNDLDGYEWSETAVKYLSGNNIVSGYGDETFRPSNNITREEFITLIVKAFNLAASSETADGFKDVAEDAWYWQYVKAAQSNKIVEGYDGIFGAGTPITRQDAVVILERALLIKGYDINNDRDSLSAYSDAGEISDYAYNAVNKFVGSGIISGMGGNILAPKANCRRAEMAVMLYNVLMRYNEK